MIHLQHGDSDTTTESIWVNTNTDPLSHTHVKSTSYRARRKGKEQVDGPPRGLALNQRQYIIWSRLHLLWKHSAPLENNPSKCIKSADKKSHQNRPSDAHVQLSKSWSTQHLPARGTPVLPPPSTTCRQPVSAAWHDPWKFSRDRKDILLALNKLGNRRI